MTRPEASATWRAELEDGPEKLYADMLAIRNLEHRLDDAFRAGEFGGFLHLSLGQEAVAVGVACARRAGDYLTLTHRSHGHLVAAGVPPHELVAEIYWGTTGLSGGFAGHVHMGDLSRGLVGGNGVLGQNQPIAAGMGLALKRQRPGTLVVSVFGDGTGNEGAVSEAMNLSAVLDVPVLWVCERNNFAQLTGWPIHYATETFAERAVGFGLRAETVDGADVEEVGAAARALANSVREGEGPALLEVVCERWVGHYVGDPEKYRTDLDNPTVDPLDVLSGRYPDRLDERFRTTAQEQVTTEIAAAIRFAQEAPRRSWEEYLAALRQAAPDPTGV